MTTPVGTVPEMIYAVSHDIGEPIREILGFAQLLAQRAPDGVEHQFWADLGHVECGALRARAMLGALCDFIRIDELEPEVAEIELADLHADVLTATEAVRSSHPTRIDGVLEGRVRTFPAVAREVLIELVTNASRFGAGADDKAHVTLTCEQTSSFLVLSVEDRGDGIAAESVARATQLFQRLHRRSEYDTIGAGLALARRKVERCGGRMTLGQPDTASGSGLRVDVTLPIPAIDLRATDIIDDLPVAG